MTPEQDVAETEEPEEDEGDAHIDRLDLEYEVAEWEAYQDYDY